MNIQRAQELHSNQECWYKDVCILENPCNLCVKYAEMSYMMENSNLPKAKQRVINLTAPECDIDAYRRLAEIKSDIYDFVQSGKSLYIASSCVGNGKTSWAIKLMHKYFETMWDGNGFRDRAVFIHVPTFLMKCKDFSHKDEDFERIKKLIMTVDLVVWDDIASTQITAYDYSQLLVYLDHRSLSELSNICTGNYTTFKQLVDSVGGKVASRVWTSNTEVIIFKGEDMR